MIAVNVAVEPRQIVRSDPASTLTSGFTVKLAVAVDEQPLVLVYTYVIMITYVYTNTSGCSSTATASFTVNPLVSVEAGSDLTICLGSTATLTAINGLSYSWSPGSTLSFASMPVTV